MSKRGGPGSWARIATAFETIDAGPGVAFRHHRGLLIRGRGYLRCDVPVAGTAGLDVVFRCPHEHRYVLDALECAWRARTVGGYTASDPVAWGRPPTEPAP
jgi:hypothetical protein